MRTLRYLVAILIWGFLFLTGGLPYFYMLRWTRPEPYQEHLFLWFAQWNQLWLRIASAVAGLRVEYELRGEIPPGTPVICVSNHYGVIDAPLLITGALRLGIRRARGVSMQEAREWPVVGTILEEGRTAWMRRSRDPKDLSDLERFSAELHRDGDSAVIFPEGRVFEGEADASYTNVLRPKHRGLATMVHGAPQHAIVVATIIWHDYEAKKSRWLATIPPGDHCTVLAEVVQGLTAEQVPEWLFEQWHLMDQRIADHRDHKHTFPPRR